MLTRSISLLQSGIYTVPEASRLPFNHFANSHRAVTLFAGADAPGIVHGGDEHLAVANLSRSSAL
jgi:hypothetical protein